ncbi:MAG TPA: PAS domain S-box protein [Nostocaceae cyanobacterium]|nr:PAS domain S-box protein [Nostocaceae cyanobacterium]
MKTNNYQITTENYQPHELYLTALAEVQRKLLNFDGTKRCYQEIVETLGLASQASRVYVFNNHQAEDGSLLLSLGAEWCAEGTHGYLDNSGVQNLVHKHFFLRWAVSLARGEIISGVVTDFSPNERLILEKQGIFAILILPIIAKDQFLGLIGFDNCVEARVWGQSEISFLQAAAGAISLAADRKRAEDALQKQLNRSNLIREISYKIRSQLDTQTILETATKQIGQVMGVSRVLIHNYLVAPVPKMPMIEEFLAPGYASLDGVDIPVQGNLYIQKVLSQDKAVVSNDVENEPLLAHFQDECQKLQIKSMIAVRISYTGEPNGIIWLHQCAKKHTWTAGETELLESIAAQLGIALAQAQLLEQEQQAKIELDRQNLQLQNEIKIRTLVEDALKASESKYRHLVETSQDMIWSVDIQGTIGFVNQAVKHIYGYEPQEMIGHKLLDFIYLPDKIHQPTLLERVLTGEAIYQYETTCLAKDGSILYLMINAIAVHNPNGVIIGATGTASNITERQLAEQAREASAIKLRNHNLILTQLAKNPALYQGDLSAAFQEITEAAAQNLEIDRASVWLYGENQSCLQCLDLFELTTHQHSNGDIIWETDFSNYFQALLQEQQIIVNDVYNNDITRQLIELYLIPKKIASMIDTPIRLGGETVGVLCLEVVGKIRHWTLEDQNFARSLSNLVSLVLEAKERQRAEAARQASEAKLASAFRSSPDPISLSIFPEGCFIDVNDSFCRFFNYEREQVIGKNALELNMWIKPRTYIQIIQILKRKTAIRNYEIDVQTSIKEVKTMLYSAEIIDVDGQKYLLSTAKDITERKRLERELAMREARLNAFFTSAPVGMMIADEKLGFIQINQVLADIHGQPIEAHFGKTLPEIIPQIASIVTQNYEYVLTTGKPIYNLEISGYLPGTPDILRHFLVSYFPIFDQADRVSAVGTVVVEITEMQTALRERKRAEQQLRVAKERLQYLLTSSPVVIYSGTANGELSMTFISENVKAMFGYEAKEFLSNPSFWLEHIHPEDRDLILAERGQLSEQKYSTYEYRFLHADGTYHWLYEKVRLIRDENGQPIECVGYWEDISDRKLAELALKASQRRYQLLAEASPVCIFHADTQGNCFYVNQRCLELTGLSPEKTRGKGWARAIHPEDRREVFAAWNRAVAEKTPFKREHRLRRPDGAILWVITQSLPEIGEDGTVRGYIGTITDISDRKQAEQDLSESAERERAITQAIQRMRQTLDLETIFAATTQELRQVLNCDRVVVYRFNSTGYGEFVSESVANGWISLIEEHKNHPHLTENALKNNKCVQAILENGEQLRQTDYKTITDIHCCSVSDIYQAEFDPNYINLLERFQIKAYIAVPIYCGSQLWGLLVSYQNSHPRQWKTGELNIVVQIGNQLGVAVQQAQLFTQTQRQSQALQKAVIAADAANRAKSEFLASMSHELRTPLNAILGFTQVMSHDLHLSSEHQQNLAIINRAGEHLLNLINDILEMSKIEAGRTVLNISSFDLMHLLVSLEEMLEFRAMSKGIKLIFTTASNLPQYIQADENKLRQVLLNLLGNAIKFTDHGSVTLRVAVKDDNQISQQNQQLTLHIEIQDTGAGIAPEEIELLFETFGQTATGRKSQQGTGLGLAISQKYVQLMGGNITVSSKLGEGSIFAFDIQITPASIADIQINIHKRQIIGLAPQESEYRILVVDDARDSRLLLEKILTSIGFIVQTAANGQEAIALWQQWQPHLILMDMQMPVMDGYTATKMIKAKALPNSHTPIIACTAKAFEEQRQEILSAGCDDLINKPFREEELLEKIGEYLTVQYIYKEQNYPSLNQHNQKSTLSEEEILPLLLQMSPDLLTQIYNAAAQCSDDLIIDLTEQIPAEKEALKNYLIDLANHFYFEKIMELTNQLN